MHPRPPLGAEARGVLSPKTSTTSPQPRAASAPQVQGSGLIANYPRPRIGGRGFPVSPPSPGFAFPGRLRISAGSQTLLGGGWPDLPATRLEMGFPGSAPRRACSWVFPGRGGVRSPHAGLSPAETLICRARRGWGKPRDPRTGRAGETRPFEVRFRGNVLAQPRPRSRIPARTSPAWFHCGLRRSAAC